MDEKGGTGRKASRALRDELKAIERTEDMQAAHRALRATWLQYSAPRHATKRCGRCGERLPMGTLYQHCAECLASRGISELALQEACARLLRRVWPLQRGPLDRKKWAHALIAFWRGHVDPAEAGSVPYRTCTLQSAFSFVRRHFETSTVARVWTVPFHKASGLDPAMVVRARGEALAIGVGTLPRIALSDDKERRTPLASFDAFLDLAGEQEGVLVVEKLSQRAQRDDPIVETEITTEGGRRVTQLRCMQEDRAHLPTR